MNTKEESREPKELYINPKATREAKRARDQAKRAAKQRLKEIRGA